MAVFAIGDMHLSLSGDKGMDIFPGWQDYVKRLSDGWRSVVAEGDTVVLAGDSSWGMSLLEAERDFSFINSLPGKKIILKGNHDYWWSTKSKMDSFFTEKGFSTLNILHNNAYEADGIVICGSRGWFFEHSSPVDKKIIIREAMRLKASILAGSGMQGERVVFLHYPPVYGSDTTPEILEVLSEANVRRCYYGHIHAEGRRYALNGDYRGVAFRLISADSMGFAPVKVQA